MKNWIRASRPKTLPAAIIPVLLGSAAAWQAGHKDPVPAFLCLAFSLLIQIGTNLANDYYDFLKGADIPKRIGPTRMVASGLITPEKMKSAMIGIFALALLVGCNLIVYGGWWLLPIGALCVLCGIVYTGGPFPLAYNGLGDLFVFLFLFLAIKKMCLKVI